MSYFPLLSNPVRPGCRAFRNSGAGIHWLRYTAAALRKISHASGPGGIRTLVQQLILGHAKILVVTKSVVNFEY